MVLLILLNDSFLKVLWDVANAEKNRLRDRMNVCGGGGGESERERVHNLKLIISKMLQFQLPKLITLGKL